MKSLPLALLFLAASAATAAAEPLAAITSTNQLLKFSSASPGTVAAVSITGLTAGDVLAGIDVRPANNLLYGFATDAGLGASAVGVGRVYTINLATGFATLAATLSANVADTTAPFPYTSVSGSFFGVDFNPVADALRVVSDMGQNLRINVATGATQLDVPLAYAAGDANFGTPPAAVASAYTNSVAGALTTTLYNLDSSISNLVTQAPPNNGTLNTTALTSAIISPDASFDISGQTGTGYAVLDGATLLSVNLTDGVMTELGAIAAPGSIVGLAVAVPEPGTAVVAIMAIGMVLRRRRSR